jgi:hypothetical protein
MYQGLLPEWTYLSNPVQSQMSINRDTYINTLAQGLVAGENSSFVSLANGVWDFLPAAATAFQQLISGDFQAALTTLANAVVVPLQNALDAAVVAISSVVGQIITNVVNVLTDIPSLASSFVATTVGVGQTLASTAVASVTNVINAITSGDFEGAWNAAVTGALGQDGFPGALETLTIGPGFGTWETEDYVSSFRVWAEGALLSLQADIDPAQQAPAEPAAALKAAAAEAAPAAEAPVADASSDEGAASNALDAPKSGADAPATVTSKAGDDAAAGDSSKADSSKTGDNGAKAGDDAKGGKAAKAGAGAKGHAKAHGASRAKAGNAA